MPRDQALLPLLSAAAITLLRDEPATAQTIAKRWLGDFEQFLQG